MVCESAAAVNLRCGWRAGVGRQKTRDEEVFSARVSHNQPTMCSSRNGMGMSGVLVALSR
jgi:hypothetical protein